MKVISIEYPTPLKNCKIKNDNIDILSNWKTEINIALLLQQSIG